MEEVLRKFFKIYENERDESLKAYVDEMSLSHLTYNNLYYLSGIQYLKEPKLSSLSEFLSVSKPSVTNMVNKLIKEGLVEKQKDSDDFRSFTVKLTPFGVKVMSYEEQTFVRVGMQLFNKLEKEEQKQLEEIFEKKV